jgi:2-hydroxychromene-2-carboxylate isomerase
LQRDRRDPNPRRAKYGAKDLQDWARFCDVIIRLPAKWPVRPEAAACGAIVADRDGRVPAYSDGIFRAYFEAGRDIGDAAVVVDIAAASGLERGDFENEIQASEVIQQVRDNSAVLIEKGGFGSPTMYVGENMFFGNDRMPLVEFAIGQTSGRTFVLPGQHG